MDQHTASWLLTLVLVRTEKMSSIEDSPVARPRSSQGKRDQENGAADEVASKKRKQVRVWVDGW